MRETRQRLSAEDDEPTFEQVVGATIARINAPDPTNPAVLLHDQMRHDAPAWADEDKADEED